MWARVWAVLVLVAGQVRASLDLYVDAEDVKQLLGEWGSGRPGKEEQTCVWVGRGG